MGGVFQSARSKNQQLHGGWRHHVEFRISPSSRAWLNLYILIALIESEKKLQLRKEVMNISCAIRTIRNCVLFQ